MYGYEKVKIYRCPKCDVTWNGAAIGTMCFNCESEGEFEKNAIMDTKGKVYPPTR